MRILVPILLFIFLASSTFAEDFRYGFDSEKASVPVSQLIEEIDGVKFLFEFTNNGDGGNFYISPNQGANYDAALVATSLSIGSLDPEKIRIEAVEKHPFQLNNLFIKPGGETVVIKGFRDEKEVFAKTINKFSTGEHLNSSGNYIDQLTIESYDMVELVLDEFTGVFQALELEDLKMATTSLVTETVPKLTKQSSAKVVEVYEGLEAGAKLIELKEIASDISWREGKVQLAPSSNNFSSNILLPVFYDNTDLTIRVVDQQYFDCEKYAQQVEFDVHFKNGLQSKTFSIAVELLEVNDQAPIVLADQSCEVEIPQYSESLPNQLTICNLQAEDGDSPISTTGRWSIISGNEFNGFTISKKGNLIVSKILFESTFNSEYNLEIQLSDGQFTSEPVLVKVRISRKEESQPEMKITKWPKKVVEKEKPNGLVSEETTVQEISEAEVKDPESKPKESKSVEEILDEETLEMLSRINF
ncbi:cadherin repeat domain-containing protein [Luteibaculum oceani]|uniref:Cadherin repeat domain-containing protein n=1 Tax=Luteibaculum oceani TaxID=1294296 RepID=A0A5C6VIJ7_9FLAO|nr:cadherin repeat domain-containing protein [Luteibaculum oceani]TXC85392.1 cadherin repeat domain-containing protein [Luteibaculum oceani]